MANLPSSGQLQDDPFGFRDEYRDSAEPEGPGFSDTAFPTPSEYDAQVRQYDAGRPTARSEDNLGTRVVPRGGQVFDQSFDAQRNNLARGRSPLPATADPIDPVTLPASRSPLSVDPPPQAQPSQRPPAALGAARARTPLPYTQGQPDNGATQNATQGGGSFSVRNLFAPGQYEALSQTMHDLAVHDPAGKKQPAPSGAAAAPPQASAPAPQAAPAAASNAPAQAADPAKTIAKGRTLGPGITLSQTELGEVAAFGPDGQVVDLKDPAVRKRFNLPTAGVPKTANPGNTLSMSLPVAPTQEQPTTRTQYKKTVIDPNGPHGFSAEEVWTPTQVPVASTRAPVAPVRRPIDVYNADRANGYTGRRDYISPFLSPDQQRARQNEIYAQRQADMEAIAQRLATENTIADLESQRTGVPTTSARNRSMLPTSERVMGERQDRMAHERVSEQRSYNLETAKQAAEEKDASMRDSTTRRGQDVDAENSRRAAQNDAENRKAWERIAQISAGSKTQRDYQREAMLKARSEAIKAALSADPKYVESPDFQKWLDKTYPLMTPEERLELEKQGAAAPDPKQYK